MQTPAPVDYVRATSVDNAIALLQEHGDEARLLAGGHSLIPMMKLRLARPDILIDINDLDELRGITVEGERDRRRRDGDARGGARLPVLAEHYAIFREAEKVIADPIVRNRGTVGGSMCQADPSEDLSAVGSALKGSVVIQGASGRRTVADARVPRGPVRDEGRRRRDPRRGPLPDPPGCRQRLREGRAPRRRLAGLLGRCVRRRVRRRGHGLRHRADRRRRRALRRAGGRGVPRRQAADRGEPRRRPPSSRPTPATRTRTSAVRPTTSSISPWNSPFVRCAAAPRPAREPDMQVTITINGEQVTRDVEPRMLLVHFLREDAGPDRHPLGLRHLQLRRLRPVGRRQAGEVLHRARRDGRRPRGPHRRGPREGRRARPGPAGVHASATACSAASAPPA